MQVRATELWLCLMQAPLRDLSHAGAAATRTCAPPAKFHAGRCPCASARRQALAARSSPYGNLSSAPVRQLTGSENWQQFVLEDLLEVYYDVPSSSNGSTEDAEAVAAAHHARVDTALDALRVMSEEQARGVPPDLLRMLLAMCHDALPEQSLAVLAKLCEALDSHPDLLVTLQYHSGARDAVTQLLNRAADGIDGDSAAFVQWLRVQRLLNIHAAEPKQGLGLKQYRPTVDGVYVGESMDDSGGESATDAEETLAP
jgi:hypothetical protein